MQHFNAWGDPYADRVDDIQVCDPVRIKPGGPMSYAGQAGWCIDISETEDYTVMLPGGTSIAFDQDVLIKLEFDSSPIRWLFETIRQQKGNAETVKLIKGYLERCKVG